MSVGLLDDLTEAQKEAVTHPHGPILIVAAAGSGKTRVITRRVAWLMEQGVVPSGILAITFTNKAAGELKSRVGQLMGRTLYDFGRLDHPWPVLCTFHSLCLRILKHYATQIGLPNNFSIFDSADQTKLMKQAIKDLDLSSTNFNPGSVHATISNAKNKLQGPEEYARAAGGYYDKTVARIYQKYQKLLEQSNALDFDDLLMRAAWMFRDHPDLLAQLQDRFQTILIDEYQDTNHAQYILAHALALRHRNLCVVGDPDQSIYAWRGANIQNILDFEKDYPDAKIVRLEQNYRSTKTILAIADALIRHNKQRKEKGLWTENPQGEPAKVLHCGDEHEEARAIARELQNLHTQEKIDWQQMAIFYRVNALSRVLEEALRNANIPYQMARGTEFYARKEIKDVLGYLRLIANPSDLVSLERIINVPARGISSASVNSLTAWAMANGRTPLEAMRQAAQIPGLSARAAKSVLGFVQLLDRWRELGGVSQATPAPASVKKLIEDVLQHGGLEKVYQNIKDPEDTQLRNVEELISSATEYDQKNTDGTLEGYLQKISLVSDIDQVKESGGAVTMMTLHAAKGLEFPVVAIAGMEEGLIPHARARDDAKQLEEERRLCFVGLTRARQHLLLTRAEYRTIRGLRERTIASPFFTEMPPALLMVQEQGAMGYLSSASASRAAAPAGGQFRVGQSVCHPSFGIGRVEQTQSMGGHTRLVIQFNKAGRKSLIEEFARLKPVDA